MDHCVEGIIHTKCALPALRFRIKNVIWGAIYKSCIIVRAKLRYLRQKSSHFSLCFNGDAQNGLTLTILWRALIEGIHHFKVIPGNKSVK